MKKNFIRIFMFLAIIILPVKASAKITFQITKSADNLKPGATTTVIIKTSGVNDGDALAGYDLNLNFDNSKLEYAGGEQSSKSTISPSGNVVNIKSNFNNNETGDFEVARFNFKVLGNAGSGNASLNLTGSCDINDVGAGGDCTKNSSQITVAALGIDSTLSSLEIPNTTLSPSFSSSKTDYTATIQDITSIKINAIPTDKNASVIISENAKSLQKGDNNITVTVTSENGENKTIYNLKVTLKMTPTEEELLKANALLKSLKIKNQKLDFEQNEKKYYLTVPYKITTLNITATPVNSKAKVDIEGNKKIYVGKNTIKITVTSEDKTKIENYQIIVTREDQKKQIVKTCPDVTSSREWILFTVSVLLTFTLGIVLGYFVCKKEIIKKLFGKKEKKEEAVEIETLSDTIDLSDTVKEAKKKAKKQD